MSALVRLVLILLGIFLLLPLLERRVRGRYNRSRYVQIVAVSLVLLAALFLLGRR